MCIVVVEFSMDCRALPLRAVVDGTTTRKPRTYPMSRFLLTIFLAHDIIDTPSTVYKSPFYTNHRSILFVNILLYAGYINALIC